MEEGSVTTLPHAQGCDLGPAEIQWRVDRDGTGRLTITMDGDEACGLVTLVVDVPAVTWLELAGAFEHNGRLAMEALEERTAQ